MRPIRAYRWWQLDHHGFLQSINSTAWEGPVLQAVCPSGHSAPQINCGCGIYSIRVPYTRDPEKAIKSLIARRCYRALCRRPSEVLLALIFSRTEGGVGVVHGYVDIWGHVIEHDLGYRSEFAQVHTIFLHEHLDPTGEVKRTLSARYGCEVITYKLIRTDRDTTRWAAVLGQADAGDNGRDKNGDRYADDARTETRLQTSPE